MFRLVLILLTWLLPLGVFAQEGYATPTRPGGPPRSTPAVRNSVSGPSASALSSGRTTPASPRSVRDFRRKTITTPPAAAPGMAATTTSVQQAQDLGEMHPRRPYSAFWSMQLGGQFIRDALSNQKTQSALGLNLGLDYQFTSVFFLNINPRISFKNGHVQAATATNGRESSLELVNAAATLSDRNYYLLSAGALDMTAVHGSLVVASTFPAAKMQISTGEKSPLSLSLIGLTAVPSSATLTSNSQDYDKTPSFNSAALRVTYTSPVVDLLAQVGQFEYRDIPLNVATDSVLLGNTSLESSNTPQTDFRYKYRGLETRLNMAFGMTRGLKFRTRNTFVRNAEAPTGLNQGYLLANELEYIMNGRWSFVPGFTYFNVQPDTSVANYNDAMTSTNRIGYAGSFSVQFNRLVKMGLLAGEREVIFEKASQARERFVNLTLETFDAPF